MDTEHGGMGLFSSFPRCLLAVGLSLGQQNFTAWQSQAEPLLSPRSVPAITGWDASPLKLHVGS